MTAADAPLASAEAHPADQPDGGRLLRGREPRRYRSVRALLGDLGYLARDGHRLRRLAPAFRERLMLVVTAVNACRYCAAFHAQVAVRAGVPPEEARALLAGTLPAPATVPERELPALLYAQAWAERDAAPDPPAERALTVAYGVATADAIRVALRAIRVGNLTGNAVDALLAAATGGRVGRRHRPAARVHARGR